MPTREQGFHPEWHSSIFNYGRAEVRNFLVSSALFWLEKYHADALARGWRRLDALSRLRPQSRASGFRTSTAAARISAAVGFLKSLNEAVYRDHPDTQTIAEESTAWPMVSRPTYLGGLGFGFKWNMGWMHDTLKYFQTDPIHRRFHHNQLTFSIWYAFTENFMLPLSHDEVVHGKGSLIGKMHGDEWQQFANLRLLYRLHVVAPRQADALHGRRHRPASRMAARREPRMARAAISRRTPACSAGCAISTASTARHLRCTSATSRPRASNGSIATTPRPACCRSCASGNKPEDVALIVCNFTPVPRDNYRVGVPRGGRWRERLNSDAHDYGGSGVGNFGGVESSPLGSHGRYHSLTLRLPPLSVLLLTPE